MTPKQYQYVVLRGKGKTPKEAYMEAYNCGEQDAASGVAKLNQDENIQFLIDYLQASYGADKGGIRMELTAYYLEIVRDRELPQQTRIMAGKELSKIYGLDTASVELSTDHALAQLLIKGAAKG